MNENYRHRQLLNLLEERKALSTQDIIRLLDVSPATARRDITKLNEQGRLKKVHNGAEVIEKKAYRSQPLAINNSGEKKRIAELAAKLCQDGDSVILTCGSTMLMLGSRLCGKNVQIMTNFLPLANYLIEHDHNDVVIMGGQYNKNQAIMLSLNTNAEAIYAANIMFTSGKGLTVDGLYKTDMLIANSEQRMLPRVGKLVVLLDSSKLGKQAGMLFAELHNIHLLITGKEADAEIIAELKRQGLNVLLA